MALTRPPVCDFGAPAPDFTLPDPEGRAWTRDECAGEKGLLVVFICNHCPYVQAVIDRIVRDAADLARAGVGSVAIMSNDTETYPQDGPEHMARLAREKGFGFPFLYDADQSVAKAFGAVATPDFFGYNADLELQYRGRLDASGNQPAPPGARRELYEAMLGVARTGRGPVEQVPSMGCSIKWREEA